MWFILIALAVFLVTAQMSYASYSIRVTGVENAQKFIWENDFKSPCSGSNSYVYSYPGNNRQSALSVCEDGFGITSDPVPDGKYYILLAIGGHAFISQVFTIENGQFVDTSVTPTPTPTPVNRAPVAKAGTSIDSQKNLQLDARDSYDPDGDELGYTWYIVQRDAYLHGKVASLISIPSGTYTVYLSVTDNQKRSLDEMTIGIPQTKPVPTVATSINTFTLDRKDGSFMIKGVFDKKNVLLQNVHQYPVAKVLFELQTDSTGESSSYSFVGEALQTISVKH